MYTGCPDVGGMYDVFAGTLRTVDRLERDDEWSIILMVK